MITDPAVRQAGGFRRFRPIGPPDEPVRYRSTAPGTLDRSALVRLPAWTPRTERASGATARARPAAGEKRSRARPMRRLAVREFRAKRPQRPSLHAARRTPGARGSENGNRCHFEAIAEDAARQRNRELLAAELAKRGEWAKDPIGTRSAAGGAAGTVARSASGGAAGALARSASGMAF